jgi:hypothetical protein
MKENVIYGLLILFAKTTPVYKSEGPSNIINREDFFL